MKPLLEVRQLTFSYQSGPPVLTNVSLKIKRGDFVAITGPSGSGKSTLFYLLGALTDRFTGDILFDGKSYRKLGAVDAAVFRNQNIGFVFQQFYLLPRATVLENILLPANYPYDNSQPTNKDRERAHSLAKELGIDQLLSRRPQELSGGQQQRVAMARALLRDPDLILADEPTGNLDSHATEAVFNLLRELNRKGKTVVIITHSPELANACPRVIRFKDGKIDEERVGESGVNKLETNLVEQATEVGSPKLLERSPASHAASHLSFVAYMRAFRPAIENIRRTKAKSFLTMLGVVLGIAAVLSTMSLGEFAKQRILAGYESMGVNTLMLNGWPNWRRSSRDFAPAVFRTFDNVRDIIPLQKIFSEVEMVSPVIDGYGSTLNYGGISLTDDVGAMGVNEYYSSITNQKLERGRAISWLDVENMNPVCIVGASLATKLFSNTDPIDKQITIAPGNQEKEIPCRVIGVLKKQPSKSEGNQPDNLLYMPYTYLQRAITNSWQKDIRNLQVKIYSGHDPDQIGKQFEGFYKSKYGNTGNFSSSSNSKAVSEMKLFIAVFSSMLTAVALIALIVGGVGINNMMLVNLSERLKELGLRKALGATPQQIRALLLTESLVLCSIGGILGLGIGFAGYHSLIFAATKLIPDLTFEWVILWSAISLAAGAVILTGILSGLTPALKAERLQVIDALRQE